MLQVELAHLSYQKSRLVRSWTHLERQRGGFGFLGGPGETQIEADRRALDERIQKIKQALGKVVRTRGQHRRARQRLAYPVVALVGYTNAGKSTLFNRLTGSGVLAKDMLFATLDPTMRAIELPGGQAGDPLRYRRLHLRLAAPAGRGVPRHAGGGAGGGPDPARARHRRIARARGRRRMCAQSSAELGIDQAGQAADDRGLEQDRRAAAGRAEALRQVAGADAAGRGDLGADRGGGSGAPRGGRGGGGRAGGGGDRCSLGFDQGRKRAWLFDRKLVRSETQTEDGYEVEVRWTDRDRSQFLALH